MQVKHKGAELRLPSERCLGSWSDLVAAWLSVMSYVLYWFCVLNFIIVVIPNEAQVGATNATEINKARTSHGLRILSNFSCLLPVCPPLDIIEYIVRVKH